MNIEDWKIKYQPKSFDEMVLPVDFRDKLKSIQSNLSQNLLFSGDPGRGKTLSAEILASNHERVFIKCSESGSVDRIRKLISCTSKTLSGEKRVIIIDEIEFLSTEARIALRGLMDKLTGFNIFVLTANEPLKLDKPLLSRVKEIEFGYKFNKELASQLENRVQFILSSESIRILDAQALASVVNNNRFDYRKLIGEVQSLASSWKYQAAA